MVRAKDLRRYVFTVRRHKTRAFYNNGVQTFLAANAKNLRQ